MIQTESFPHMAAVENKFRPEASKEMKQKDTSRIAPKTIPPPPLSLSGCPPNLIQAAPTQVCVRRNKRPVANHHKKMTETRRTSSLPLSLAFSAFLTVFRVLFLTLFNNKKREVAEMQRTLQQTHQSPQRSLIPAPLLFLCFTPAVHPSIYTFT